MKRDPIFMAGATCIAISIFVAVWLIGGFFFSPHTEQRTEEIPANSTSD